MARDLAVAVAQVSAGKPVAGDADVTDLDAAYDRAVARGARPVMAPCPSPEPGVRMAFVADPEGNLVELLHRGAA